MEEKIYRKIGKCLKEIRRQRGFTKKQVSKHLKISRRKLIRYEKGVEKIDMDVLERLLTLYGFSYKEFLNYVKNPEMYVLISLASHKIADEDIEVIAHINQFVINLNLMYSLEKNKWGDSCEYGVEQIPRKKDRAYTKQKWRNREIRKRSWRRIHKVQSSNWKIFKQNFQKGSKKEENKYLRKGYAQWTKSFTVQKKTN